MSETFDRHEAQEKLVELLSSTKCEVVSIEHTKLFWESGDGTLMDAGETKTVIYHRDRTHKPFTPAIV